MSSRPKLVYEYFKQLFAQVTRNAAIIVGSGSTVVFPVELRAGPAAGHAWSADMLCVSCR